VHLDEAIVGTGIDAPQLVQAALDRLAPEKLPWLHTKIRQTLTDGQSSFDADGFLQRGPRHCVRLDMSFGAQKFLRVISDGETLVEIRRWSSAEPQVVVDQLPEESAAKEENLAAKGCAGPCTVLRQLQQDMKESTLQTGLLENVPVICIRSDLAPQAKTAGIDTVIPARQVNVYLSARTLWPLRFEWHGVDKAGASRRILCLEFTEPDADRDLTVAECTRMFSYRPDEDRR
jgi:hypothetical protein